MILGQKDNSISYLNLLVGLCCLCLLGALPFTDALASPRTTTGATVCSRQSFLQHAILGGAVTSMYPEVSVAQDSEASVSTDKELQVFQLPSGLRYIDLEPGTGASPKYGQFVAISYKAYMTLPNQKPQLFDQTENNDFFLWKHGNGRILPGLDEGIHGMKEKGKRRILIPPKLGFVQNGLGPLPSSPFARQKLNSLIDQMVEKRAGTLVYEVSLQVVRDDEADQGYYSDASLSPEDFNTLRLNISEKATRAREEQNTQQK